MGRDLLMAQPTAPAKAELRTENNEVIPLLFNPAELTITKAASWNAAESKGNNAPLLKFSAGQPGTLTLSITLDTTNTGKAVTRSEEHTSELQSQFHLVCRLLLEKKKK